MAKLAVNVDHVATLRQARMVDYPDPVAAARMAIGEGVAGITVHLREDRRHIQESDVRAIHRLENCKLNLEMAASEEIIEIALDIKPYQVTIVPEKREELTTEGGLDVAGRQEFYYDLTKRFKDKGIKVSFFIDADPKQLQVTAESPADALEINTGHFSEATIEKDRVRYLRQITNGVKAAKAQGMIVHAGHGLNYRNVAQIAEIKEIEELNIGHSIVAHSVFVGFALAVSMMKDLVRRAAKQVHV